VRGVTYLYGVQAGRVSAAQKHLNLVIGNLGWRKSRGVLVFSFGVLGSVLISHYFFILGFKSRGYIALLCTSLSQLQDADLYTADGARDDDDNSGGW
jgi:hypothetical protein